MKPRLIAGNWKMHKTAAEAVEFVQQFRQVSPASSAIDIVVAPPFVALYAMKQAMNTDDRFLLGAQDLYWENEGAYTGEISGPMLKSLGCEYVIIGHSERRRLFSETDEEVNKKVKAALQYQLAPIMCVGETLEQREANQTQAIVKDQTLKGLHDLSPDHIPLITIAYEPVWAIGTGQAATVEQAEAVHVFLRSVLTNRFGQSSQSIRILYGGSVSAQNAGELFQCPDINGALVGKACLDPDSFAKICQLALSASP